MLLGADVLLIIWFQVGATMLSQGIYIYYALPLLEPTPRRDCKPEWALWGSLLRQAAPLLVVTLLGHTQIHLTRLLIGIYLGTAQTGIYAIATNLVLTVQILPPIYFASVYPLFVRYVYTDPLLFQQLYQLSFRALMIVALPLAVFLSLTSSAIVTAYAGEAYAAAAPLLAVLAWGIVLNFAGVVLYHILLATRQQGLLPRVLAWAVGFQLLLLCVLLPALGTIGAGIANLSLYIISLTIYGILPKTRGYILEWLQVSARAVVGALLVGVLFLILQPPALIIWFVGVGVYGVYALLVILSPTERRTIYDIIRLRTQRGDDGHAYERL
jgi:O-antigen/teichoic acid export membrane protein